MPGIQEHPGSGYREDGKTVSATVSTEALPASASTVSSTWRTLRTSRPGAVTVETRWTSRPPGAATTRSKPVTQASLTDATGDVAIMTPLQRAPHEECGGRDARR